MLLFDQKNLRMILIGPFPNHVPYSIKKKNTREIVTGMLKAGTSQSIEQSLESIKSDKTYVLENPTVNIQVISSSWKNSNTLSKC